MRFLLDQDVYAITARFLRSLGHDVVTASEIGSATAADHELLQLAEQEARIFVTRDRDFGGLVFVHDLGAGVIYLRLIPSTAQTVHDELQRVVEMYDVGQLRGAFVVVEPGRHRFRRLPRR